MGESPQPTTRTIFSQETIHTLHGSMLSATIDPRQLLNELDPDLRAMLERNATSHADHLLSILSELNRLRLIDGSVPFRTVLKTACLLAGPKVERLKFDAALRTIDEVLPDPAFDTARLMHVLPSVDTEVSVVTLAGRLRRGHLWTLCVSLMLLPIGAAMGGHYGPRLLLGTSPSGVGAGSSSATTASCPPPDAGQLPPPQECPKTTPGVDLQPHRNTLKQCLRLAEHMAVVARLPQANINDHQDAIRAFTSTCNSLLGQLNNAN